MKIKKNPNNVHLKLTDRELRMASFIQKQEGQADVPSVFHDCLRIYYNKQYVNKHKQKVGIDPLSKTVDLTPEQLCEQVGGRVDNMTRSCEFKPDITGQAVTYFIPLGDPNDMLKRLNEIRKGGGKPPIEI